MALGVHDVEGEKQAPSAELLERIHRAKTGALLRFACVAGGILAQAKPVEREALEQFGSLVGQAFQIADDILDVESDAATLGKAAGKDAGAGKGTLVSLYGLAKSKERLTSLVADAEKSLAPFGAKASVLIEAARFIAERKS